MKLSLTLLLCCYATFCLSGCGSAKNTVPIVLVQVDTNKVTQAPFDQAGLDDLVKKNALDAAKILNNAMKNKNSAMAAWAAIYALRLGIKYDNVALKKSLLNGLKCKDDLLLALCYRWIAVQKDIVLPKWNKKASFEPVVFLMAALAYASKGKIPQSLSYAFALPNTKTRKDTISANAILKKITILAMPYDDGPLAMSIVFCKSRRDLWTEENKAGETVFVAARLLKELLSMLALDKIAMSNDNKTIVHEPSRFLEKLNLTLYSWPKDKLRNIIVLGSGSLQREALKALAVIALVPEAGDFGAAAVAMQSVELQNKIEAARTYLLLVARSTK